MPSPIDSIICILAVTATSVAAVPLTNAGVMRREDKSGSAALAQGDAFKGVVSARGHFFAESTERDTFEFRLKSILVNKCLQLDDTTFSTKECDMTEPKQKFKADGISGPSETAVATSVTAYNDKLFCSEGGTITAKDDCDADNKKFKFTDSGVGCFRVKLFLADKCLTTTMAATEESCSLDASQFTAETSQSDCPSKTAATEEVKEGEDGLPGGGGEGGNGGEAEKAVGGETGAVAAGIMTLSTPAPTPTPEEKAEEGLDASAGPDAVAPGTVEGGTVAPGTLANPNETEKVEPEPKPKAKPKPLHFLNSYRLTLKNVKLGVCLRLEGQTFQMATCDHTDHQQTFIARGFTEPGQDVIASNVTMYNGKVLCFDGSTRVEAYDETCVENFAKIELEPTSASDACFKVKFNANAQIAEDLCLAPPNGDQDMKATHELCASDDSDWTADPALTKCN